MPTPSVTAPPLRVVLKGDSWHKECTRAGLVTDSQRADAFGTSRVAVNQIQNGRRVPSNEFIAGAMEYFSARFVRFEELFTWTQVAA